MELDRLRAAVVPLNEATDRLNAALEAAEVELAEVGPGVQAWITLKGLELGTTHFGYCKFPGGWHLAVRVENEPPSPILRAPRYLRLGCYKRLPQIVQALTEAVEGMTKRMNRAGQEEDSQEPAGEGQSPALPDGQMS